jgi:hypothetical protein
MHYLLNDHFQQSNTDDISKGKQMKLWYSFWVSPNECLLDRLSVKPTVLYTRMGHHHPMGQSTIAA